jgi:hypothetical protein
LSAIDPACVCPDTSPEVCPVCADQIADLRALVERMADLHRDGNPRELIDTAAEYLRAHPVAAKEE